MLQDVLQSEKIIHLSHTDLDGYTCGLLVGTFVENCLDDRQLEQHNVDYGGIIPFLEELESKGGLEHASLLITDLNIDKKEIALITKLFGHKWYIIDHHVNGEMDILNHVGHFYIDSEYSATKLTYYSLINYGKENVPDRLELFDTNFMQYMTSITDVYDLYRRDSFLEFNMGRWMTSIIKNCRFNVPQLRRNYFYNIFSQFHNSCHIKYPVLEKRLVEFNLTYIMNTWKDHHKLVNFLFEIYPDLKIHLNKIKMNTSYEECLRECLDYIPMPVMLSYLEYLYINDYIKYEDDNMIIFNGISSNSLVNIYDILFADAERVKKIMINVTVKPYLTSFSFRSKNKMSGKLAAKFAEDGQKGGGHDDASGASIDHKVDVEECIVLLKNYYSSL